MKMVKHHNIVKLYEVLASRTKIFIVLELITGGELFDKILAESRFDERTARFYFRQLLKGVKYCHGQGVCHRDLKPENLLLDEKGDLKISDFGLSALYTGSADDEGRATVSPAAAAAAVRAIAAAREAARIRAARGLLLRVSRPSARPSASFACTSLVSLARHLAHAHDNALRLYLSIPALQLLHTTCGTPNYVAPEVLNDKGYDGRAADLWSCGVILYVLLAGFLPFDEPHMSQLFRKIQKAEFSYPSWFTAPVKALLSSLLVADPAARATIADIEANPWFIGPDSYHDDGDASAPGGGAPPTSAPAAGGAGAGGAAAVAKPLAHAPSEKDIEDAVAEVGDEPASASSASASSGAGGGGGGAPAHPSLLGASSSTGGAEGDESGPPALNAFELVNMFGGLALNKLMEAAERRDKLFAVNPQFISALPAPAIMGRIATALSSLGGEVTVDDASFKVKGKVSTGKGLIVLTAQIYGISDAPPMHLVEMKRGRGDILEYNAINARVRDMLADIVSKGSVARITKA